MALTHRIHIISDSTGETIAAALRAAVAMFTGINVVYRRHVMIRSRSALDRALRKVEADPGLVVHTVVDPELRQELEQRCLMLGTRAVAFLDPLLGTLQSHFETHAALKTGAQHRVDDAYYARVAALDFALAHDDGTGGNRLRAADIVLIGVSRTSKTPTCVYLAGRGVKAANVPIVPGREVPPALFELGPNGPLIIGLTAKPTRIAQIRGNRLESLGSDIDREYADLDAVRREVVEARQLMERLDCPIIDVTRRSIEETAAACMAMLEERRSDGAA